MNLDIDRLHKLLEIEEKLRGHPKLKHLHNEITGELEGLAKEPEAEETGSAALLPKVSIAEAAQASLDSHDDVERRV